MILKKKMARFWTTYQAKMLTTPELPEEYIINSNNSKNNV